MPACTDPFPFLPSLTSSQALVVSHETVVGGEQLNAARAAAGLSPLVLIVTDLIGADGQHAEATKLSSTALRLRERGGGRAP